MKLLLSIFIFGISVFVLAKSNFKLKVKSTDDIVKLTIVEKTQTLTLRPNQQAEIYFESNPTTGYDWHLVNQENVQASNLVSINSEDPLHVSGDVKSSNKKVGEGTQTYFVVRALGGRGSATLKFAYIRSWEKNEKPLDEREVVINID